MRAYCTDLGVANDGEEFCLYGWVNSYRNHGSIIFIDLRDKTGLIQLVCDPNHSIQSHKIAVDVRDEFVLKAKGRVRPRAEGLENPRLKTGQIEVLVDELVVENKSLTPPFLIGDENVSEDVRLKYRFLDLRSPRLFDIFSLRSRVTKAFRDALFEQGFLEIETPILNKPTPEGARDYLVPSRLYEGSFYALPQSPQIFKQLLMVSGFDKYYQIARCFRDEDLRSDRQPEFTQVDIEMSFCTKEDIMNVAEEILEKALEVADVKVQRPFMRLSYDEAMQKYGSDKPDLRYDLAMIDVMSVFDGSSMQAFANLAKNPKQNRINALNVKACDDRFSRKSIKELEDYVKGFKAQGLAYVQAKPEGLKGPILKFLSDEKIEELKKIADIQTGDIVFFGAGSKATVLDYMGRLRAKIASDLDLIRDENAILWVEDFPMFEVTDGKLAAMHHPFTSPTDLDMPLEEIKSLGYDVVLNGYEIGGGSIRIHKEDIQEKVFELLGISPQEREEKFGFLLDALKFGAPPHGGIALGLDRIIMLLAKTNNIRDVIAFPKTQKAQCLMSKAPAQTSKEQLEELHINFIKQGKQ